MNRKTRFAQFLVGMNGVKPTQKVEHNRDGLQDTAGRQVWKDIFVLSKGCFAYAYREKPLGALSSSRCHFTSTIPRSVQEVS